MRRQAFRLTTAAIALAVIRLAGAPQPAHAATLTFDFGLLGASTTAGTAGTACSANCVIAGTQEQYFTTGGISVGAIGYNASGSVAYVTQKPGTFNSTGGETGIGESNTPPPTPSDGDYEITTTTWLLIDNTRALSAGYLSSSISIESIQSGEGANVYAYTGPLGTLNTSNLTLLASVENPNTGASPTQTVSVPNNSGYLVVQANGTSSSDVTVAEVVLNTRSVPEPGTITLFASGIAALGTLRRRRSAAQRGRT